MFPALTRVIQPASRTFGFIMTTVLSGARFEDGCTPCCGINVEGGSRVQRPGCRSHGQRNTPHPLAERQCAGVGIRGRQEMTATISSRLGWLSTDDNRQKFEVVLCGFLDR